MHERWARLRFSVIGQLLAAPPEQGALRAALEDLAAREWRQRVVERRDQAGDDAGACPTGKPKPQDEREQGARTKGVDSGRPDEEGLAVIVAVVPWWWGVGRGGRGTVTRLPAHRPLIVRYRVRSLCLRRRAQCAECCAKDRPPAAGWSIRRGEGGGARKGFWAQTLMWTVRLPDKQRRFAPTFGR